MKSVTVRKILEKVMDERGVPRYLRSDNGSEFICRDLQIWLACRGSQSHFIQLGSPWQNGHAESFMSRLRAECLDAEVFYNLLDSRLKLGIYRRYYNQQRPHSALQYVPPAVFAATLAQSQDQSSSIANPSVPVRGILGA
jgi:transposase InsO family protein